LHNRRLSQQRWQAKQHELNGAAAAAKREEEATLKSKQAKEIADLKTKSYDLRDAQKKEIEKRKAERSRLKNDTKLKRKTWKSRDQRLKRATSLNCKVLISKNARWMSVIPQSLWNSRAESTNALDDVSGISKPYVGANPKLTFSQQQQPVQQIWRQQA